MLKDLGTGGKNLAVLILKDVRIAETPEGNILFEIPTSFPELRALNLYLANISRVGSDEMLTHIGKNCSNLRKLVIGPTWNISEVGLGALLVCEKLHTVELYGHHLANKASLLADRGHRVHFVAKDATMPHRYGNVDDDSEEDADFDIESLFG